MYIVSMLSQMIKDITVTSPNNHNSTFVFMGRLLDVSYEMETIKD